MPDSHEQYVGRLYRAYGGKRDIIVARRGHAEVSLQVRFGRRAALNAVVAVDERQVLALKRREPRCRSCGRRLLNQFRPHLNIGPLIV